MSTSAPSSVESTSGNPALSRLVDDIVIDPALDAAPTRAPGGVRRVGVVLKTLVFLGIVAAGGVWGWASATDDVPTELGAGIADATVTIPGGFWLATLIALFVGIVICVNPHLAAPLGVVYAIAEGFTLGAISAMFDARTDGIVGAAILSTLCVATASLVAYSTGIVRPTRKLAFGVVAAMGGLALLYLLVFVFSWFDWGWRYSDDMRTIGILVTLFAVILAALSLVLDIGAIDQAAENGLPRRLEWYLAFSLTLTLVWLYVEMLRLLALLARNR